MAGGDKIPPRPERTDSRLMIPRAPPLRPIGPPGLMRPKRPRPGGHSGAVHRLGQSSDDNSDAEAAAGDASLP